MYKTFLSWRYLTARRTNLIGIVGILVGVFALILILSIMTGFLDEQRKQIRGALSDLIIEPRQGNAAGSEVPAEPDALLEAVRSDPRVAAAAPQLVWGGIITQKGRKLDHVFASQSPDNPLLIQLVGIDVEEELETSDLRPALVGHDGRAPHAPVADPERPFDPPPGYRPRGRPSAAVLIGDQLYDSFGLEIGDVIQIGTVVQEPETGEWRTNNREFVVAGSFRTGENKADLGRLYVDRRELANFLGGYREYTQLLVRLNDYERDARRAVVELRGKLAEAGLISSLDGGRSEVRTWEEFRGNLIGAIENERVLMAIMLSLVLVVAGFTVFAILSMLVTEKRRDIGILLSLGATQRGIRQLFLRIAFWDALLGTLIGGTFGVWAALKIDSIERWLSRTFNVEIFRRDVYMFDHIPAIVHPEYVAAIVLGAFACALLFAAIPAWQAARLDPLEALRYE